MPFSFTFNGSDLRVVESLQLTNERLIGALTEKMTYLMQRLQEKAQSKTKGMVRDSIRNPQAYAEGGNIIGTLQWGGDPTTVTYKGGKAYDVAQILEYGAVTHAINPLTEKGTRAHEKGAKRRFGSNVLHFYSEKLGKEVFAPYAFHPGIVGQHFMESSVLEMKDQIRQGLANTLTEVIRKRGK